MKKVIDEIKENLQKSNIKVEEFIKNNEKFLYFESCIISQEGNCKDLTLFLKRDEENNFDVCKYINNSKKFDGFFFFWTNENLQDVFNKIKNETFDFEDN
jgi:hypothetical protein